MIVKVAESAGFCYGVQRAVAMAREASVSETPCYMLGPVIHNDEVIGDLLLRGICLADSARDIPPGCGVIIRSHGCGIGERRELIEKRCKIIDATCPHVARIHRIAAEESAAGRTVVIVGEASHPEVAAIAGNCGESVVVDNAEALEEWLSSGIKRKNADISFVFQTTLSMKIYLSLTEIIKKECTKAKIFDTICNATSKRQREAAELSQYADAMIVIGGRTSANTKRLFDICKENCSHVVFAETAENICADDFRGAGTVGITAGASTPACIIKEVSKKMSEDTILDGIPTAENETQANREEATAQTSEDAAAENESDATESETFEQMVERSFKMLTTGERVKGIVTSISPTEISVDLGTKQSGYIPISEITDDPNEKVEDIIKIGDEIETFVMRVNDVEGMVTLSKKRINAIKNWSDIEAARDAGDIVEGKVTEDNKGGVVVSVKGIRVFIPAGQSGLPKNAAMSELVGKTVKLKVTEVNQPRRRVVGSIRLANSEVRREASDKIWTEIAEGKTYQGVVKSLTSFGAFVDIGGIDGMVHVSELSWDRKLKPSDVLEVGQEIDVFVVSFDLEKKKISLGYKGKGDNPWNVFTETYHTGDTVTVKIVKLMAFGAFAEIIPGVDGLIHISQIADRRIGTPAEVLTVGQTADVKITEINLERHKISLSIRALIDPESQPLTDADIESARSAGQTPEIVYDTDNLSGGEADTPAIEE